VLLNVVNKKQAETICAVYQHKTPEISQASVNYLLYQAYATKDCTILNTAKALAVSNSSSLNSIFLQYAENEDCSFADLYKQLDNNTDAQQDQDINQDDDRQNTTTKEPETTVPTEITAQTVTTVLTESTSGPEQKTEKPEKSDQNGEQTDVRKKRSSYDLNLNTSLLLLSTNEFIVNTLF
jgi:hypothetical protein